MVMSKPVSQIELRFAAGTLEISGLPAQTEDLPADCRYDGRTACHRAPAKAYAEVLLYLRDRGLAYTDSARRYAVLEAGARVHRQPRPYQTEALSGWLAHRGCGVVVLPTGAGKTHVACMAIDAKRRSALVVAPTLELVRQWYDVLRTSFGVPVGVVGGGEHTIEALTVTTYDSAAIHMEHMGNRFGLIVFDECHHLPGPVYSFAARACLAPFRLGLSATPERADGRESDLEELIGPIAYRKNILELSGEYLAEYETVQLVVELSPSERAEYEQARGIYRDFIRMNGIQMGAPDGWSTFIMMSARSSEGRRAFEAFLRQREIAFATPAKLDYAEHLLRRHRRDRSILFTQDNATAYAVSRRFLLPVITHQTKVRERSEILQGFSEGRYGGIVTSKVLNEGVDVPSANVAIVLSGSGSVREHVQRLGRILRKQAEKRAILYELVSAGTTETFTSQRRREHVAYR